VRPTQFFGGHSDFVFLVEDLGQEFARKILGVSEGTFALWLAGDAEAPQMACMALYPWSQWHLQIAECDHRREVAGVWNLVEAHRYDLRRAQRVIDELGHQLSRPAVGGPANDPTLVRFDGWSPQDVPRHTLEAKRSSDLSDERGLTM
jgi:hypothetical protein